MPEFGTRAKGRSMGALKSHEVRQMVALTIGATLIVFGIVLAAGPAFGLMAAGVFTMLLTILW